jgi:hypothetical protein
MKKKTARYRNPTFYLYSNYSYTPYSHFLSFRVQLKTSREQKALRKAIKKAIREVTKCW